MFLEMNKFSGESRAFWQGALLWAGLVGNLQSAGAQTAAKCDANGVPWALMTGQELTDGNPDTGKSYAPAADYPRDSIWLVRGGVNPETGKSFAWRYYILAEDATAWKRSVKAALKGDLNGGESYDAWTEKRRAAGSTAIMIGSAIAAVVVSVVATPAAGAAVMAGGSAIAGAVQAGGSPESIEAAIDSGAAIAGAAGVDPAVAEAVANAASVAANTVTSGEPEEASDTQTPAPARARYDWRAKAADRVGSIGGAIKAGAARAARAGRKITAPVVRGASDAGAGVVQFAKAHQEEIWLVAGGITIGSALRAALRVLR